MQINTDGLVIREQTVGESDRLVTLLTRDAGIIKAFARQAKNIKNSKTSATGLLCYSSFSIYKGKEKCMIDEARPKELFFGLRDDIGRLALAQYFCELAGVLAPEEAPAEEYLRLILNALFFLSKNARPQLLLKAVVEMRMLSFSGYMPDLLYCRDCGCYEAERMFFFPDQGMLLCGNCGSSRQEASISLSRGELTALRHTVYADFDKLFSFQLPAEGLKRLAMASESYMMHTLQRRFATLDFYRQMASDEQGNPVTYL
jgi:DNA repair protein RecO (recombination protein O)